MARPIWNGTLSFGLLHVPVALMSGERKVDLHFRMLDARNNTPIRYERINAETGEEVPWKDIVKAFEYDTGQEPFAYVDEHGTPRDVTSQDVNDYLCEIACINNLVDAMDFTAARR